MGSRIDRCCGLSAALAALLLLLPCAPPAAAQGYHASRITTVNGRQVLEVRMGIVPGNRTLRTLVITAGPVAGSTSLLASATAAGSVMNPAVPMLFSVVVNSGGLYSLGGGCPRAGELNFPYIDGLQFRIVRYTGATQTIVTPPAVAGQFEGVNCTTAANGQAVFYTLANRTSGRIEVWREGAGNVFTRVHNGSVAIRLPFNGGIRPQISRMFRRPPVAQGSIAPLTASGDPAVAYEPAIILVLYQRGDDEIDVDVVDTVSGSVRGRCVVGARSAGPPPYEAALSPDYAVGDFNGDGQAESVSVAPVVDGLCQVGARIVSLGSAAGGNGFTWTGYALAGDTLSKEYRVLNGPSFVYLQPAAVTPSPSPFSGRGGPFHAAHLDAGEFAPGILAVGSAASNLSLEFFAFAPGFAAGVTKASFEDPVTGEIIVIDAAPSPP